MTSTGYSGHLLKNIVQTNNCCHIKLFLKKYGLAQKSEDNCLALIEAVKVRNYEVVEILLRYGILAEELKANVYYKSLHYAIEDMKMLKILLRAGASIAGKSYIGKTPLMIAMKGTKEQNFPAVDAMLSMYNIGSIDPSNKNDVIHFSIACARNNEDLVEHFIRKGMNINVVLDNYFDDWVGCTPIYLAVIYLASKVVKKLLSHGASFVHLNQYGFSPLHNAYYIWKNKENSDDRKNKMAYIIDLFLSAHKSILTNPVDSKGLSHFDIACIKNNVAVVKIFLQSAVDLNVQTNNVSPLHTAVVRSNIEVIDALLNNGFKVDLKNCDGDTALHIALKHKFYGIAELLLKNNANVRIVNKSGYTPIHETFLRFHDSGELVDFMLAACDNKIIENLKSSENLSLFHIACARGNARLVEELMAKCAIDVNEKVNKSFVIHDFDYHGFTPLHFATKFHSTKINFCTQTFRVIELLLKSAGLNINATNEIGVNALWYALESQPNYSDINSFIVDNFADELAANSNSVQQIIIQSIFNHSDHLRILELLLKNGAICNYESILDEPLLCKAYRSVISGLTETNVDYKKDDLVSKICRQYFYNNCIEIIKLLISYGVNRNESIFHHIFDSMCHSQITKLALDVAELLINSDDNPTLMDQYTFMALKMRSETFMNLSLKYHTDVNRLSEEYYFDCIDDYNIYEEIVHFLLENGSAVNARVIEGQAAFFEALDNERPLEAMKLLLEANCDVNTQDGYGNTALAMTTNRGKPNAVKILLDYGADINIKDNWDNSLLEQFTEKLLSDYSSDQDDDNYRRCPNFDDIYPHYQESNYHYKITLSNNANTSKIFEILTAHVYKLQLIRFYVGSESLDICHRLNLGKSFTTDALRKELAALKESKVDKYTSLYDIVLKSTQQMARHVLNKTLQDLVNSNAIRDNFPNYGYLVNLKYRQGIARIKILKKSVESFRLLEKGNLGKNSPKDSSQSRERKFITDSCIDSIFCYLTNKDLENLSRI